MGNRGLLGRLGSSSPDRRVDVVESVVAHLRSLLNMRIGSAVTVPTMGIPDFSDLVHTLPGSAGLLTKAIRATILAHEPRLTTVFVRHIPAENELVVRFEVSARLADKNKAPIRFETEFAAGGRAQVWSSGGR